MQAANLDDLALFAVVAREGSFTRAAALTGNSTSNLSHTIRRLETRLGVRLLERNSRSVAPSEAGAALLSTLTTALGDIEHAIDTLQSRRDSVSGTLRLTATREAYEAVIRPVLPAFARSHPDAVIEVLTEYAFRDLVADGFDAGIRIGEKLAKDMIAIKLGPELRMAVVAAPAYLASHPAPAEPRALAEHRCINHRMLASGALYRWEFERDGRAFDIRVSGSLTFSEPGLMLEAALDGIGIAYVLEHEAAPHLEAGRLVRLLEAWTPPFPGFFLYHPSKRHMRPILTAFIAALRRGGADGQGA